MTTDEIIARQQSPDYELEMFFDSEDAEDIELENVVRMLRADSSAAYLTGGEAESKLIDRIVERLEAHEHRR